jgi:hypothetical protein
MAQIGTAKTVPMRQRKQQAAQYNSGKTGGKRKRKPVASQRQICGAYQRNAGCNKTAERVDTEE